MNVWIWGLVLLLAVSSAKWGSGKLAKPLKKLSKQWGFSKVAAASLLALVTASPEVGISTVSAIRSVSDIGLGNMLGSNIIALPLIMTTAYIASRKSFKTNGKEHQQHLENKFFALPKSSVYVLTVPYLLIVGLVAVLTIPEDWRGLQPVDGWIILAAFFIYLGQALWRGKGKGEEVDWNKKEIFLALSGVLAVVFGAYFTVRAAEHIIDYIGISLVIGGLFITSTLSTVPEVFKTWKVVSSGQPTAGSTSVIGDKAITMTLGFFPLAIVTTPISNFQIYWVNIVFVALIPAVFSLLVIYKKETGLKLKDILILNSLYILYLVIILGVIGVY
ncbi:sodium:calcium antiporter [Pseudalkalibacillus caeni]|uniref:Sodium:calcium exchanger n=1 Tax=Exobacillus caeni TaxID=2574798 RepID=A0A5R9FB58_9BACL|nr:sodium:calcium exchanger [Pseudalkalibacillus caeni]TLS38898.1 sodium:calcium exchanger [Pseudalkalibacillus caeni]